MFSKTAITTYLFFISLSIAFCNPQDKFTEFIEKCMREKKYNMAIQIEKSKNCINERLSKATAVFGTGKFFSPNELLCGQHSITRCLDAIQRGVKICAENEEIIGYSYNAIQGGLKYLCDNNGEILKKLTQNGTLDCFQTAMSSIDSCYSDGLVFKETYSPEMCRLEGEEANCIVGLLDECKDKTAMDIAKRMFASAFSATKCNEQLEEEYSHIFQHDEPISYKLNEPNNSDTINSCSVAITVLSLLLYEVL